MCMARLLHGPAAGRGRAGNLRPPAAVTRRTVSRHEGQSMGILEGKRILVTGVLTDASLAFAVAQRAVRERHKHGEQHDDEQRDDEQHNNEQHDE